MNNKITEILVVDDDAFARQGLRLYLESLDYRVHDCGDVQSAWEFVLASPPQMAVIDIRLPLDSRTQDNIPVLAPNGITFAQQLKHNYPSLGIILLSAHEEYEKQVINMAQQYMRSIAFLHKGGDMGRLQLALSEVQAGRTLFQKDIVNKYVLETAVRSHFQPEETLWIEQALTEFERLSSREQEVANLMSASYDSNYIADRLGLSKGSVDNIISRIYLHLGLNELKNEALGLRPLPILIKACLLHDIKHGF